MTGFYYDMSYYNYSFKGANDNGFQIYPYYTYQQDITANHFNFMTGFGYHLHMIKHVYMSMMTGVGVSLEYGKEVNSEYDSQNPTQPKSVTNEYSRKSLGGQFKLGIGYVF